jgi:hypothetical protein
MSLAYHGDYGMQHNYTYCMARTTGMESFKLRAP